MGTIPERRIRTGPGRRPSKDTNLGKVVNYFGLTVTEVAHLMGVSTATASATINGHRKLRAWERHAISQELDVRPDWL
ncbi:MAG: LacI family DNA-binding transcriptional regulator [bacterium]|nr:LacI family DNA-binding transcriptional regulator [bacterium]